MKIRVDVEVPDKSDKCQSCKFRYLTVRGINMCDLWGVRLEEAFDGERFVYKCPDCLSATKVEVEE